jgi:hypothetical protein
MADLSRADLAPILVTDERDPADQQLLSARALDRRSRPEAALPPSDRRFGVTLSRRCLSSRPFSPVPLSALHVLPAPLPHSLGRKESLRRTWLVSCGLRAWPIPRSAWLRPSSTDDARRPAVSSHPLPASASDGGCLGVCQRSFATSRCWGRRSPREAFGSCTSFGSTRTSSSVGSCPDRDVLLSLVARLGR